MSAVRGASSATDVGSTFQLSRWVILCTVAETLGITAAAAATLLAEALLPGPRQTAGDLMVLLMIVAGGLVEGFALGTLQSIGLVRWIPAFSRPRWILWTTAVAGLGWAAASAPAQFSDATDTATPPIAVVVSGGLLLGALMGAILGAAQAGGLRGRVRHPWRWIGMSVLAWAPAMGIIFAGASTAGVGWPALLTLLWAAVTGAAAGATLGLLSGLLWPVLHAPSWSHAFITGLLKSRAHRLLDSSLAVLRVEGRITGLTIELPVQYALDGSTLTILPGRAHTKRWWKNLQRPSSVKVLLRGEWRDGEGQALVARQPGYEAAVSSYLARWPKVSVPQGGFPVIVRVELSASCDLRPYGAVLRGRTMVCMSRNMRQPAPARGAARTGAVGRRFGYFVAALVNVVLLWLVTGWPGWQAVPFLTGETQQVIVLVVLSLLAGVATNLVNFALDLAWIKALGEIVTSAIALAVLVRFWEVFPFDFGGSTVDWALVTRVVIVVAVAGCCVSIIVQIVVLVRAAFRAASGHHGAETGAAPLIDQEPKDARNRRS